MCARYAAAGAFDSADASAKSLTPRFADGGLDITSRGAGGGGGGAAVAGFRIGRGDGFERIQNQAAAFAAKEFVVGVLDELLKDVRQDAHAAAAALAVARFGQRDSVVALGDAFVKNTQIFRDGCDGGFAL